VVEGDCAAAARAARMMARIRVFFIASGFRCQGSGFSDQVSGVVRPVVWVRAIPPKPR
jgi:hypothetical protein